jgi:hypothetical protein
MSKKKSAVGQDGIHNLFLVNTNNRFRIILLQLINNAVLNNTIPKNWKEAIITIIPKKDTKSSNPKDYRPISVTSCLGKLAERMIKIRLMDYLEEHKLIVNQQSGFRKHRQTKDNLVHLIQKSVESFNRKKKVCAIFFDIASSFDKVWHQGLIHKLIQMKIPIYIIKWCMVLF